jgi:hypothetical protein
MKRLNRDRLERLYKNYGMIRFGKIAVIKKYSYKYMLQELLFGIAGIPINLVLNIIAVISWMMNLIPRIYIESEKDDE